MEIFPEIGPRKIFLIPQIRRQVSAHATRAQLLFYLQSTESHSFGSKCIEGLALGYTIVNATLLGEERFIINYFLPNGPSCRDMGAR